ncbi:MAG: hypothetical protein IKE14_11795 [Loktanella sp.]|nr:hypothetical protein [Loktanella sp.]
MKFAIVGAERQEPQPKLKGHCPGCGEEVTAKCGTQRVWHWAHKGRLTCDPWWETETRWHRAWKNRFALSWQEVPLRSNETGELHIADVRTPQGLVMEFQHSAIDPVERTSRESFYQNMLWVVDCTRLKTDVPRIDEHLPNWRSLQEGIVQTHLNPAGILPRRWLNCAVPVLFDFNGFTDSADKDHLICLLPGRFDGSAVFFALNSATLVAVGNNKAGIFDWQEVHRKLFERKLQELRAATRFRLRYRRRR